MREVSARCPLAMGEDLMRDLAEYKSYRNKAVMAASRSLIQLFRNVNPELLHKRDRVSYIYRILVTLCSDGRVYVDGRS